MPDYMLQQLSKVQENDIYLNQILKLISEGVVFINAGGKVLLFNLAAQALLKMDAEKVIGRPFWSSFLDDALGFSMKEALRFGIAPKLCIKHEMEIRTIFIYDGPKETHGILLMIKDVGEKQKRLTETVQKERMRELGEMSASMAHEVRNLLGSMRGYGSLLIRDLAEEKHLQDMASQIVEGTKTLEKMVGAVLHYSKPVQCQLQTMDIGMYLKQMAKWIKVDPAFPPHVKLALHIPDAPLLATIDPERMKGALLNLMFNALQAMPMGGTLTISLMQREGSYQVAITDTGVGMGEEELKRLFVPFYTTKRKGNGLGLIEVQKIVQAHLGTLDVRSQIGLGTTFTITLPMRRG
jgi:signal transduction histidine kinase